MVNVEREEFKFPDETPVSTSEEKVEYEVEDAPEIEVVDDTPEADKGRKPMKEAPAEVTDDELEQYSDGVKKRIQHFSKGYHEERRAKEAALREREEALRLAQNLVEENKRLQGSLGQGQQALLEQAKKVVANEVEQAKQKYKQAYVSGDSDALVAAQEELTTAKIKFERVNNFKPAVAKPETSVVQPAPRPVEQPVQVDNKARAWQDANPWFGSDDEMTAVALTVHKKLVIYSQAKLFTFIYTYGLLKTCQGRCLCEQRTRANRNYRIPLSEEKLFQDKRTLSSKTEGPCLSV